MGGEAKEEPIREIGGEGGGGVARLGILFNFSEVSENDFLAIKLFFHIFSDVAIGSLIHHH